MGGLDRKMKFLITLTCLINEQRKLCSINEQGDIFVEDNKRTCCLMPNKRTYWHNTLKKINEHREHVQNKAAY